MISNRKAEATIGLLEHPERHSSLAKREVLEILGLRQGMTVAEIGAARGDLCLPISGAVGSAGHVVAVEAIVRLVIFWRLGSATRVSNHKGRLTEIVIDRDLTQRIGALELPSPPARGGGRARWHPKAP